MGYGVMGVFSSGGTVTPKFERFNEGFSPNRCDITVFTGNIARSATRRYLIYSEADFEFFFAQQGRHITPTGVKFGKEKGTLGPLIRTKFHSNQCNG